MGASIYVAVVGLPSVRKSPPFLRAIEPVTRRQAMLQAEYERQRAELREATQKAARRRNASTGPKLAPLPVLRSVYTADATVERVCAMLRDYPRGLLYGPDELVAWLRRWGNPRHDPGACEEKPPLIMLTAYDRSPPSRGRKWWRGLHATMVVRHGLRSGPPGGNGDMARATVRRLT